jgi:hypothetical protein
MQGWVSQTTGYAECVLPGACTIGLLQPPGSTFRVQYMVELGTCATRAIFLSLCLSLAPYTAMKDFSPKQEQQVTEPTRDTRLDFLQPTYQQNQLYRLLSQNTLCHDGSVN